MFGLLERIIAVVLSLTMLAGITVAAEHSLYSHSVVAQAAQTQTQTQAVIGEAQRNELVQDVLDQAQIIVGASNVYASEHNGNWPTTIRELTEGRYLSSSVLPDTRVSSRQYRLVQDKDGFSVQLALDNNSVCDEIEWSASQNGKQRNGSFYPYDCYAEMKTFVFRP